MKYWREILIAAETSLIAFLAIWIWLLCSRIEMLTQVGRLG